MKTLFSTVASFALLSTSSLFAANYTLTINGKKFEIDLNKNSQVTLADGTKLDLKLLRKATAKYTEQSFAFVHPSDQLPAKADLGDGVTQTTLLTPNGSGVIIQQYEDLQPSMMINLIIREFTKDDVKIGHKLVKNKTTLKLQDGTLLKGYAVTTTFRDESNTYKIFPYDGKNTKLLLITLESNDSPDEDIKLIKNFWQSFKLNKK